MAQVHTVVDDDVFQRAKILALKSDMLFKRWITRAIAEKVERDDKKAAK